MTNTTNTIKTGDIWRGVWGFDQTNVDFYEVTRVTKTMITLEKLEQAYSDTADMHGTTTPIKGAHVGKTYRRRVKWYNGEPYVMLENYSMAPTARPYDGRAMYYSTCA